MIFDVFHSIGRIDSLPVKLTDREVFTGFFDQLAAADKLGFGTMWIAETHFSSEVQKRHAKPVIPNYQGEIGINCDSPQLAQMIFGRTRRINFGTAIYNIVGGNGGPIAAADRMRSLAFLNQFNKNPRQLDIGFASGRFPFINRPFGILPRNSVEEANWPECSRLILCEATEIFLRLLAGESLSSREITPRTYSKCGSTYQSRWNFDELMLVPTVANEFANKMRFVLGSQDAIAQETALKWADCDIFNLSFTAPEQIDAIHATMHKRYENSERKWGRERMPRTVLVFIDESSTRAHERANQCFDTYIEAMRGTAAVPDKNILLERALIGDPSEILGQLTPDNPRRLHKDDRLMLWFEFNQSDSADICRQMELFAEKVIPHAP
jgi:alkanesulfonate monooxygenase SsuD/methylene tetrahydromethanopterin reductase-like flavin-dependent oxidoreductase (luciferase family)